MARVCIGESSCGKDVAKQDILPIYPESEYTFSVRSTVDIRPQVSRLQGCAVMPSLPEGIVIDPACAISGKPMKSAPNMSYTITAMSENGSISTVISIEVRDSPYDKSHYSFVRGMFGTTGIPTTTEPVSSWTVTPSLPNGLMMNVETGEISGIPRVSIEEMEYTITAMSENGSLSTVISIEVRDSPYDKKPIKVGTILRNWYLASYVISFVVAVVFAIVMVIRKKKATRSAAVETKELMV